MKREFNRENLIRWIKEAVIDPAGEKYFNLETGEVISESEGGIREIYEVEDEVYLVFDENDDGPFIFSDGIEQNIFEETDVDFVSGHLGAGKFHLTEAIKSFDEVPEMSDLVSELKDILEAINNIDQPSDPREDEEEPRLKPVDDHSVCFDSCGYPHICIPFTENHIEDIEDEILLYFNCPAVISLRDWLNQEDNA